MKYLSNLKKESFQNEINDLLGGKSVANSNLILLLTFSEDGPISVGNCIGESSLTYSQKHQITISD